MEVDFGEILEPISRAFWDDYDDLTENEEYKQPEWNADDRDVICPENLKSFIVVEGQKAEELMKLLVLGDVKPFLSLKTGYVSLYHLPETKTMICTSEEKNLNYYGPITEVLSRFIDKTPEVVGISIQPSSLHKGQKDGDSDKVSFIRGLNSPFSEIYPLKEPNFITGVSAGVASWRKFHDLTCFCFAVYVEALRFDSQTIEPLVGILKKFGVQCKEGQNINIKAAESNLYM
ncbi:Proteasome assembly chaperone 1 [Sergentomyia squamirostris]